MQQHTTRTINVFVSCLLLGLAAAAPAVTVKNLRLFYGEDEYFIKGVTYSPTPLSKFIEGQTDGTGYCTPHKFVVPGTFTTSTTSPCYYDDWMDATSYAGYAPNGMTALWQRDFPLMQSLGVNTIRTYHAHPVTQASILSDSRYTDKSVQGSNHVPFMDAAQQYGMKVVFPLFADQQPIVTLSQDFMRLYITTLIDEVGNHPALLMYTFGNELQFFAQSGAFLDLVNSYLDFARSYQLQKWGRAIPVTCALIDYPLYYNQMADQLHVDIMMTNAGYRGFTFTDLWSGSSQQLGWKTLSCSSRKPVLVGEMGVHRDTPVFDVVSWFPTMWKDILDHKNQGAIGGFLFAWVEEHWKGVAYYGQDWTVQPDVYMGLVKLSPGTGQFPVDQVVKKYGGAYDWNGVSQGFSINQWAQDGPNRLSSVPDNLCGGSPPAPPTSGSTTTGSSTTTTGSNTASSAACQTMFSQLQCRTASENPAQVDSGAVAGARSWLCQNYPTFCAEISTGGAYSSCNSVEQLSYAMSLYYAQYGPTQGASACSFGGVGQIYSAGTTSGSTTSGSSSTGGSGTSTSGTTTGSSTTSCQTMFSQLQCRTASEDPAQVDSGAVAGARSWLCQNYPRFCAEISTGGAYSSCNSVEQLSYAMSLYYAQYGPTQGAGACSFGGVARIFSSSSTTSGTTSGSTTTTGSSTTGSSTTGTSTTGSASGSSPQCSSNLCGASSCCPDGNAGNLCYSSNTYKCVVDGANSKAYLCPASAAASCNGGCYDPSNYKCSNGGLTHV